LCHQGIHTVVADILYNQKQRALFQKQTKALFFSYLTPQKCLAEDL